MLGYLCFIAVAAVFSIANAANLQLRETCFASGFGLVARLSVQINILQKHISTASFIKPCSRSDPNLNQCIKDTIAIVGPTFAQGIPELGVKSLDPVELGKIVVNNPSLKLTFDDTVVTGLGGFRINNYKINMEKSKALVDFTANVTLKAHYVMDGKVLILPIKGDGQAKIKITNLNIIIKYDYKTVDGFWTMTSHKDEYKMDRAQFKFTNLFNGNKDLADTTIKFLNENWSIIMQEIAPPAMQQIIDSCLYEVQNFYNKVPADLLFAA